MKAVGGEFGSIVIPLAAIRAEICPMFTVKGLRGSYVRLKGGESLIQCLGLSAIGNLDGNMPLFINNSGILACICGGCWRHPAFETSVIVESDQFIKVAKGRGLSLKID